MRQPEGHVHALCAACRDRRPAIRRTGGQGDERCCRCQSATVAPTYVVVAPQLMPCQGRGHLGKAA